MGSPLLLILAALYMNDFENYIIINSKYKNNIKLWTIYINDILILWREKTDN